MSIKNRKEAIRINACARKYRTMGNSEALSFIFYNKPLPPGKRIRWDLMTQDVIKLACYCALLYMGGVFIYNCAMYAAQLWIGG